jgi:CO/xanthine dehydrogenase FAD-binding subunit
VKRFTYARPETLVEALTLLAEHGPAVSLLAGGTDLIVRMRHGHKAPRIVIDLKRIPELHSDIVEVGGRLQIGALTVMTTIINNALVRQQFPALVEAAKVVGSVQIRNRATVVGNICNASPAADTASALLVYEALVYLVSLAGERCVPLGEFFIGPGRTVLKHGEIVRSIGLPLPRERNGSAFGRITRRYGVDLATINLCCRVQYSGHAVFAFGAAAPRPFIARDYSGILGRPDLNAEIRDAILRDMIAHATPISDIRASKEYRDAMLLVASQRALQTAVVRLRATERPD